MNRSGLFFILLFSLLISFSTVLAQDENEGDSTVYRRGVWFYRQRGAPNDYIPVNAMQDALAERDALGPGNYYLTNSWASDGPSPMYYEGNACSGRITTIRYGTSSQIYVGGANGGVMGITNFSNPLQDTWQDYSAGLKSLSSGAIAIDRSVNPPIIYYGSGESIYGFIYSYLGQGLFKSTDGGATWAQYYTNAGLPADTRFFRISIRPNHPNELLAATNKGLYRSTDAGASWLVIRGTGNLTCNDVVFSNSGDNAYIVGYATSAGGVGYMISTNGGANFSTNANLPVAGRSQIAVCKSNNSLLYAVTDMGSINDTLFIYIYKSTDSGNSFTLIGRWVQTSQLGFNLFVYAKPDNENVVFFGAVAFLKTTDGGITFSGAVSSGSIHSDLHDMDFNPTNPNEMVIACDGGAFISQDGGNTWNSLNGGMNNTNLSFSQAYSVFTGSNYLYSGVEDHSTMKTWIGNAWSNFTTGHDGTTFTGHVVGFADYIFFVFGDNGHIIASTDGGSNSSFHDPIDFGVWDGGNDWMGAFSLHPINLDTLFYAIRADANNGPVRIWRSTNDGRTFGNTFMSTFPSSVSPQNIEISRNNTQIMYVSTSGYSPWPEVKFGRELYKSSNGGLNWSTKVFKDDSTVIPNRYITKVATARADNPASEDEVYITLSGFYTGQHEGHIFKSLDGGGTWGDISGNLPSTPVNDLVVWYTGATSKNLIAATDIGVFVSANNGTTWQQLAAGLPNTVAISMEYQRFQNKLRVCDFGRGIFELDLPGTIYIRDNLTTRANLFLTNNNDIAVCNGGNLILNTSLAISMPTGRKISVQDGGQVNATGLNSNQPVLLQGNAWGGIEFTGSGSGLLKYCKFMGCDNAISITGNPGSTNTNPIEIDNCDITGGLISSVSRDNVTVQNSNFIGSSAETETAISIVYGNNTIIANNSITNAPIGISVSNSSPVIIGNNISITVPVTQTRGFAGISMNNSYSSILSNNNITKYKDGIYLYYSEPVMLKNTSINTENYGADSINSAGMFAKYLSSPRLQPTPGDGPGQTIWDAGLNNFQSNATGDGLFIYDHSQPALDYGNNSIIGTDFDVEGTIEPNGIGDYTYFARQNCWGNDGFSENVSDASFVIDPVMTCQPGGGGEKDEIMKHENSNNPERVLQEPPQPLVINYGHGIYDTINVTNQTLNLPAHLLLYSQGLNSERAGVYLQAINYFKQVLQNYPDSSIAIPALKKIIHCCDKSGSSPQNYADLRSYYISIAQNHPNDTSLVKAATELATKCLVRQNNYSTAITEYEGVVNSSPDALQVLCAELNIVETYMIMQQGGQSKFTGRIARLKPENTSDGIKKINELLHHLKIKSKINAVPTTFSLSQNYPNPFNPTTTIKYAVPQPIKVSIKIYDILGRLVKTLVNDEFKDAGFYEIKFDGTNFASGVYFYRIEAGKFVHSKKMVIVK